MLAGVGFGWVHNQEIVESEEEDVDESSVRVELTLTGIRRTKAAITTLNAFIKVVGRRLSYLDASESYASDYYFTFRAILSHCVNLEHLVLSRTMLRETGTNLDDLLKALSGGFGQRLVSLDIDRSDFDEEALEKLVAFFTMNSERIPVLREIRLPRCLDTNELLCAFQRALLASKTLRVLELSAPDPDDVTSSLAAYTAYLSMEQTNQNELLPSPLPLKHKLAFLSVLRSRRADKESIHHEALEPLLVAAMFEFAADDVRRRIYWTPPENDL